MLNLFAASGHNNYAKSCRLYLQSAVSLEYDFPELYNQFMMGNHTVKRTEKAWSGLWTDLSIEQMLMKSLKGRGGVVGRGITENVLNVWTKTMHRTAEVSAALDECIENPKDYHNHKELGVSRIKRDHDDYGKVSDFFRSNNPFIVSEKLIGLRSGIADDKGIVTSDKAEEIGEAIQKQMTGKTYSTVTIKRSQKVINLQSLYSNVTVEGENLDVNPMTLFLRLITVVTRQPDTEVDSYFQHELAPYPMSLFKDGKMRDGGKSKLKEHLLKNVPMILQRESDEKKRVADGGALLWSVDWKRGGKFKEIFNRYTSN